MTPRAEGAVLTRAQLIGDLDTTVEALRGLQMLLDNTDDPQCPVHIGALVGLITDKLETTLSDMGWESSVYQPD